MAKPYVLPPLPQRPPIKPMGRLEGMLDGFMARSLTQRSWPVAVARWGIYRLAKLTLHFGRVSPYVMRPWYWLSGKMRRRMNRITFETVRTLFFRRVFSLERINDGLFRPGYAAVNWVSLLIFLWFAPGVLGDLIEGIYAYGTYPFGTYENMVITQTYANAKMHGVAEQNTFSVHGYITEPNGETEEVYLTLGPNIWFWELVPEYEFGKIPVNGVCTFYTYGWMLRIPTQLRIFSAGALYALNPWIVGIKGDHCQAPTNVPTKVD